MTAPPRLKSSLLVAALIQRAEAQGGFGAVLAKGDATSGSIGVLLLERGANPRFFERLLDVDGCYRWHPSPRAPAAPGDLRAFLDRARRFDRDSWIIELDIASSERFADEMNSLG